MILGIDTSCYTTSVALVDVDGRLLAEGRRPLSVAQGERGLRQSEGLFSHVKQLPQVMEEVMAQARPEWGPVQAVSVSSRPRPVEGSYMPVFLAGEGLARSLAAAFACPLFRFSHQEGHIEAALASAGLQWKEPFLALHLSGGTGELLFAQPLENAPGFQVELIGDCDLPPGQFVDRVGVALGLPFPAGPHLEKLAGDTQGDFRLSGSVQGTHISFSGPESAAQRAILAGVEPREVTAAVLDNIAKSLEKAVRCGMEQYKCRRVIAAGGVAANARIRRRLEKIGLRFAEARFAGDNAFGIARLGDAALRHAASDTL
ncbi:MAG: O-sialoglycoprotein endopeptidase [Firmicutes bacterium]|nr:O-sialoglycoprotein endopeptidase [Bacillota bacterium]